MANAMEAVLQYVEEEAAYEFGDRDAHDFSSYDSHSPDSPCGGNHGLAIRNSPRLVKLSLIHQVLNILHSGQSPMLGGGRL